MTPEQTATAAVPDAATPGTPPVRTVLLASPRSLCAGVERAVEIVEQALELYGAPVYVRKQIVHNTWVVADLEARGAVFVAELDEVPEGATVVFSAHGVAPAVRADADRRGLAVIDATCPLVAKVHAEARRAAARSDTIVLIGHADHEEVEGTLGEAPDRTIVVDTPAYLIDDVSGIRPEWLDGAAVIGLTAGASAPHRLVAEVVDHLAGLGPIDVRERSVAEEVVRFGLPREVRPQEGHIS